MPNNNIEDYTGLILISGQDKPGITAGVMQVLTPFAIEILDIEQLIIRDRLILTILISLDPDHSSAIASDLAQFSKHRELDIAVDFTNHNETDTIADTLIVVVIGDSVNASSIAAIASEIAKLGGNIQAIRRTAKAPIKALEIQLSIPNDMIKQVQRQLALVASEKKIDLAVGKGGKARTLKRVVLLDMDSTLIEQEVIDLLARFAGHEMRVKEITEQAMKGEIDFKHALSERVLLLKGLDESIFDLIRKELTLTTGAEKLISELHRYGHKVGVVSGGFINVIEPLLKSLKIDFYQANTLEVKDGKLTGRITGPIIDKTAKYEALKAFAQEFDTDIAQTVAIGDGANDIEMLQAAGLGIAFNAKPQVADIADTILSGRDLSVVLLLLGISC
jgi:phosphoserine phosphatase